MLKRLNRALVLLISLGIGMGHQVVAYAQQANIDNGKAYLRTTQNPDGSWGGTDFSLTDVFPSTSTAVDALKVVEATASTNQTNAIQYLSTQTVDVTDYLSRRIVSLTGTGTSTATDLTTVLTFKNTDSGWGGALGFTSDILDTALALQALSTDSAANATAVSQATSYLLGKQNVDGGWGLVSGDISNVFVTALVMQALETQPQTTDIANALAQATTFLLAHQNADGGFGGSLSTVWETSLAFLAISKTTGDVTARTSAINYLLTTQQPDGSWNQDPYSTALALQALHASLSQTAPPPPPTTGTLTGTVKDGGTQAPLSGVLVEVQVQGLSTMTDASGAFTLSNVTAGSVSLTFAKTGYQTGGLTTTLDAGSVKDLGTLFMTANPTTGIITGTVTDAQTGNPLEGVAIGITGPANLSTLTAADGTYTFTDVPTGSYTLTASKTGYDSVTAAGDVVAGSTLIFSPALYPEGTSPGGTTGTITGTVIDADTSVPITTATVTLVEAGLSAGTDPSGQFLLADVPEGTYSISISAPNYVTQIGTIVFSGGSIVDLGLIQLGTTASTSTVSGVVSDAQSGLPLSGAMVSLLETGATITTEADGSYSLSNIDLLNFTLKATATGYAGQVITVSLSQPGMVTVPFSLSSAQIGTLEVTSLTTDQPSYPAHTPVAINATVLNTGSDPVETQITMQIYSPAGSIVTTLGGLGPTILTPNLPVETAFNWDTAQNRAGVYSAVLRVTDPAGVILAEEAVSLPIQPTVEIADAVIGAVPRFTRIGAAETVTIELSMTNRSNIEVGLMIEYEILSPSGVLLNSGVTSETMQPEESAVTVPLSSFSHTFAESGDYPIQTRIFNGTELLATASSTVMAAPAVRIDPNLTLTPQTVTPDGDKRIRLEIRIEGTAQSP
jgi:prenyltransferase beta subunit